MVDDIGWSEDPLPCGKLEEWKVGDEVYYWRRRRGTKERKIVGKIVRVLAGGDLCTVSGHPGAIPVQAVPSSRLRRVIATT